MKLIDTQHSKLLSRAMDAYALRQKAIASNVANVDTPGYKRIEVDFERHLQKKMEMQTLDDDLSKVKVELKQGEEQPLLEDEMMTLADTQIRVQLVTRALRHNFSLLRTSITGRTQ